MKLHGAGFIVTPTQAASLGLGRVAGLDRYIRPYLNGRDLTQRSRGVMVIDLFGLSETELRQKYGDVWQHLRNSIYEQRAAIANATTDSNEYARLWWLHGKPRPELRRALQGLHRYLATVETAKHRVFCFLPVTVVPDNKLICIATDDPFHLGVLSSQIHVHWALAVGALLEDRPVYVKTSCFDPFPFPETSAAQRGNIAAIAEELDSLRRTRLDAHPQLTMTGLYNVLEKLRAAQPLTPAERDIHDAGQVSIIRQLHDQLDLAVADAYGWPVDLPAAQIVARVVALNIARRAEEAEGLVRWLRPEFQAPLEQRRATQTAINVDAPTDTVRPVWPSRDPDRYVALRAALASTPGSPADLSRQFARAPAAKIKEMLDTLVVLGQARVTYDGKYVL